MCQPMHFSEIFDPELDEWTVFAVGPNSVVTPWVNIKQSSLANGGKGAFAAKNFKKGTVLGWYTGRLCSVYDSLLDGEYAMDASGHKVIDAASGGSWTRFINDGRYRRKTDKCNVEVSSELDIVSCRYIRKGQELFFDYGKEYWNSRRNGAKSKE